MNHWIKRVLRTGRTGDDAGVALITALGVIVVITALSITSFTLARQALGDSERVEGESAAFRVAQSGLDKELATFSDSPNLGAYPKTGSTGDGAYSVTVENLGLGQYRLVSTGTARDGSVERVAQSFYFMNLWKMNFAGTGDQSLVSGAKKISGGSNIVGPFYMKGTLEIDSSMLVAEGPIFARVGGGSGGIIYGQGQFGLPGAPVDVFCDGNIDALRAKHEADLGKANAKVVLGQVNPSVPDIQTPTITQAKLVEWAGKARQESTDNRMGSSTNYPSTVPNLECATGQASEYRTLFGLSRNTAAQVAGTSAGPHAATYKYIGAENAGGFTVASKGAGAHGLHIKTTTPSFGWWGPINGLDGVTLASTNPSPSQYAANVYDDFAWDAANRVLYIQGTVFIDGPLTIDTNVRYVGNGTIVANGPITINGHLRPAGGVSAAQGRANEWALGLVTPTRITFTAQSAAVGSPTPQSLRDTLADGAGAFFGEDSVNFPAKFLMQGSVISGTISAPANNFYLVTNPLLPEYLPDSLPGSEGGLMFPSRWMRY